MDVLGVDLQLLAALMLVDAVLLLLLLLLLTVLGGLRGGGGGVVEGAGIVDIVSRIPGHRMLPGGVVVKQRGPGGILERSGGSGGRGGKALRDRVLGCSW